MDVRLERADNMAESNGTLKEKLFYWKYDDGIRFSKTKFFSILIFLYVFIGRIHYTQDLFIAISVASIVTIISFVIGYLIHSVINNTSTGSNGLIEDIKHLFFYWEDSGKFVLSKTKTIYIIMVFIIAIVYCISVEFEILISIVMGIFFAMPLFLIGYFIHNSNNNNTAKKIYINNASTSNETIKNVSFFEEKDITSSNESNVPEFKQYSNQVNDLKEEYHIKDEKVRQLVEKAFQPPQLTYDNFISYLDQCNTLFNNQVNVIETIFDLASENSNELDKEIGEKINILKLIIDKIDLLKNELILLIGKSGSDDEDISNLLEEMENLIESVKNYEN